MLSYAGAYLFLNHSNIRRSNERKNYFLNNSYTFDRKFAVNEISKHLLPSGGLGKGTLVSAEKVFSFTLNLLDPDFKFEGGWEPVTMDTWMATFFYPKYSTKQKRALLSKTPNYVLMARKTQELAAKYGMKPVEMQAALWVGTLKGEKGENYNTTFDNAIDEILTKLNVKIDEFKKREEKERLKREKGTG